MSIRQVFYTFEHNTVFSEQEAWSLFRIAAFAEAVGWSLLIAGILLEHLTGSHAPVAIAGRIHGTLFLGYMVAAAGLYPNLKWNRWAGLIALAASVPPYGSLIFEQIAGYMRSNQQARSYSRVIVFGALTARGE
jgi:integral membrane protein